jgi:hypothetical protein
LLIVIALVSLALGLIAIVAVSSMWGRKSESSVILPSGSFSETFSDLYGESPGSMTEYRSERLEAWFRSRIPIGTDRAQCRKILSESFNADLTTGDFVVIDSMSVFPAGGEDTKVRMIFDADGRFQDVEVKQNRSWASIERIQEPNKTCMATPTSPSVIDVST